MHPNLERLIALQALDSAVDTARRAIGEIPARVEALEAQLAERNAALGGVRQRLTDNQTERRTVEKDLAVVQGRLTKYRDQLMTVKTNKEYQAMQKEIAVAEREVRTFEDRILELMLGADEIAVEVKTEEQAFAEAKRTGDQQRKAIESQVQELEGEIARKLEERRRLITETDVAAVALFDHVAKGRRGLAVVPARNGHCSVCHVRLRPQSFNEVRRNEMLIQCESCQRILYYVADGQEQPAS